MESIISRAAKLSIAVGDDEWHERLHTVCYKHFSHYDEDFQHIQLYWGCLTRLFTLWIEAKDLPVPDWTTTNPRLPAWATILFETTESRAINHVQTREMGGADPVVASLMDNLYSGTFATWFTEAAVAPSEESDHEESCPHDLELEFLNYVVHAAPNTSTKILYEDEGMTATEIVFDGMSKQALTLLKHHKIAEDATLCPPLSLTIDPDGVRHLIIPWKIFHAFIAAQCELEDFGQLAQWLPGALHFHGRMDISYTIEPYDEEPTEDSGETRTFVNPIEVMSLEISHEGDEEHAVELREVFDEHIRPYLEEREVFVEQPEDVTRWKRRAPFQVEEDGNVTRSRMLGVLGIIEHLVIEERAGEVQ